VSTASPIRGNNQLMVTVGGGGDERGGRFLGMGRQKRVEVVVASRWSHWNWSPTKLLPHLLSAHPRALNTYTPVRWVYYQCFLEHVRSLDAVARLTGVSSIFSHFGINLSFKIIFNLLLEIYIGKSYTIGRISSRGFC